VLLHRVLKRVPITIIQAATTDISIKRDAREPGAAGTCVGKWAAIPAHHSIWRDRGPAMGRTPADRQSARSSFGDIMLEKSSARKTVNGSFKAATTGMRCEPDRGRLPTPSRFDAHRALVRCAQSMIRKSGRRFPERIMLGQNQSVMTIRRKVITFQVS
jgi:hypothetical protein